MEHKRLVSQTSVPHPTSNDEEAVLLHRIAHRDPFAFEALYRNYYRRLTRFIERMLRAPHLIDEVLDDTMLVVWRKACTFNDESRVSTWIFAIAYKKTMKALKREGRVKETLPDADEPISDRSPETDVIEKEAHLRLTRLLAELSVEQRAVVELTYFYGYSYREIATIVGCPVNTVKTRMFHAHRKLKSILGARGEESGRDAALPVR